MGTTIFTVPCTLRIEPPQDSSKKSAKSSQLMLRMLGDYGFWVPREIGLGPTMKFYRN